VKRSRSARIAQLRRGLLVAEPWRRARRGGARRLQAQDRAQFVEERRPRAQHADESGGRLVGDEAGKDAAEAFERARHALVLGRGAQEGVHGALHPGLRRQSAVGFA